MDSSSGVPSYEIGSHLCDAVHGSRDVCRHQHGDDACKGGRVGFPACKLAGPSRRRARLPRQDGAGRRVVYGSDSLVAAILLNSLLLILISNR